MSVDAVVFDLDGTLTSFSLRILDAKREFVKRIRGWG